MTDSPRHCRTCGGYGNHHTDRHPTHHCQELARRGTGTGVCDQPLDQHGNCPNPRNHVDRTTTP